MIKLEKEFIGKICETCHELNPICYKTLNSNNDIEIHVKCGNSYICKNALFLEASQKMNENKIIEMLGDIRYEMFDILEGDVLPKVLLVIDKKMDLYRNKSNEDIAKELIKND